ncbi:MAG: signal peptidase I [Tannerellaceae bacterium]|jgi:signal peptidase I|nr:signal peptidase I [Tannerellaceae bacterium]
MRAKPRQALSLALPALVVVIAVVCVRTFIVASYRISTSAMETALAAGDYVLVDKTGSKSRLRHNDVFLFTSPLGSDRENSPLIVSRCIALPGDTIEVSGTGYKVNGMHYPLSPTALSDYAFSSGIENSFLSALRRLNINVRDLTRRGASFGIRLTPFEEYQIREELTVDMNRFFTRSNTQPYAITVPYEGLDYRIDEELPTAYGEAILGEAGHEAAIRNHKLYINNSEQRTFRFRSNYYWALSDHIDEAVDSRHVGFIPADRIVGKVFFCWFSSSPRRRFKTIR